MCVNMNFLHIFPLLSSQILFSSVIPIHKQSALQFPNKPHETFNPLNPELNPICYVLALLGAHHFLHVSRIRVKSLTFRRLMSYIYGAPILDVSRSHTTTQHKSVGLLWTSDQLVAETST